MSALPKPLGDLTACCLQDEEVALLQFGSGDHRPRFAASLTPARARELADELLAAAAIAERKRPPKAS